MRFSPFLILLCLYLYQCNGAPPRGTPPKIRSRGVSFTNAEDNLITEELSGLPDDKLQKMTSKNLWDYIAAKHHREWARKTPGFPQVRTAKSLRDRLRHMTLHNNPQLNSKVPEKLKKLIRQDLNKSARGIRTPYTPQEEQFILEELKNPSCNNPFSLSTLNAISENHAAMSRAMTPGFENERSAASVRSFIDKMKHLGLLPDEVLKKIRKYEKGASSSNPTPSNELTDLEMADEDDDDESD